MHNHFHDIANILTSTGALLAAVPSVNSTRPVIKNASNEVEKPEITAAEVYVAPGSQYSNAREALAHLIHELHNPKRDSYNETLDFTYAKLPALLDMLRDPIYQHGLMLNQELKTGTNGLPFDMITTFHHIPTTTEVSFALPAYIKEDKRLDDCQRVGASYTYFRR
ncbi:ERF family protein [Lelliottia sp. CFBP8978]|uniref:ERF family protein n=1 Tax=Lelliottia sp. CFBP8978 TaxID=3096522 RepID=UPI002A6A4EC7|nr:ERF family protein [Lelliottia sp. CFBP8978]MDY1035714.1 ERF family protein [Lelliottia sp. CFBP8978]